MNCNTREKYASTCINWLKRILPKVLVSNSCLMLFNNVLPIFRNDSNPFDQNDHSNSDSSGGYPTFILHSKGSCSALSSIISTGKVTSGLEGNTAGQRGIQVLNGHRFV